MLNYCIDCEEPSTVIVDDIFYCASCALKRIEEKPTTIDKKLNER